MSHSSARHWLHISLLTKGFGMVDTGFLAQDLWILVTTNAADYLSENVARSFFPIQLTWISI